MLKRFFHIDHLAVTLLTFVQILLIGIFVYNINFLNPIAEALNNFSITDIFFEIQHSGQDETSDDLITLVDMKDLRDRGSIGILLDEINQEKPLAIGIDIIFEGVKDDSLGNSILTQSAKKIKDYSVFANKLID